MGPCFSPPASGPGWRDDCSWQLNEQPLPRARKHFGTPAIWSLLGRAAKAASPQLRQMLPVSPQPCSLKAPSLQREHGHNTRADSAKGLEEGLALRRDSITTGSCPQNLCLLSPVSSEGTLSVEFHPGTKAPGFTSLTL